PSELRAAAPAPSEPIPVYTGPTRTGAALIAAVAADSEKQASPHRGKKMRIAAKKPDAAAEPKTGAKDSGKDAKSESKSESGLKSAAKSAGVRHANAKPDTAAKAAEKPAAAVDKPAAKPKAVAKPKAKSTTSDARPVDPKAAAPRT